MLVASIIGFELTSNITKYVGGHWWSYFIVYGADALDSILFFLIPSEGVTIAAGVLAAQGHLSIYLVIGAAALGVFAGDNLMYWIGRGGGDTIAGWICRTDRGRRWYEQGEGLIRRDGEYMIIAGRFIPAGRSAATLAAGVVRFPYGRFARADAVAALVWGVYASMLGYAGGQAWEDSFWKPLVLGLGLAFVVATLGELWRRRQGKRGKDILGHDINEDP